MQEISKSTNIMTSRFVYKWKFVKNEKGEMERTIRLRLVLRGFMDLEAFDVETFSGTARRSSQRLLASAAACNKKWIIASMDINMAFFKVSRTVNLPRLPAKRGERCVSHFLLDRQLCCDLSLVSRITTRLNTVSNVSSLARALRTHLEHSL